jgi:4-amino-4-deoxy-L-arabinose transferase-like glycosyltransferase
MNDTPASPTVPCARGVVVLRWALVVGLLVRAAILSQTGGLGTGIVDEQHYRLIATNIQEHREFSTVQGQPTSIRPPLYPALVAAVWTVTSPQNLQAVRVVQILLALGTAGIVFAIGRRVFGREAAYYAAAVCWLYPPLILFNFLILTETLFTFLLLLFVLLAVAVVQAPRAWTAVACGVALGLAALTRSVLWPLPLVLCPMLAVMIRAPLARRLALPALVFVGYAIAIGPWAVRNTRLQEVVTVVDTMGGINLRMGNYEFTPDDRMWDAVSLVGDKSWVRGFATERPDQAPTEGRKDKWAQRKAVEYMLAHPTITARRALIKFADFWGLDREFIAGVQTGLFSPPPAIAALGAAAIVLGYVLVVCTGAAGAWLAAPRDWRLHLLLLLPVLVTVAAHTIVFGHSRYHVPLMPILGLYAAALFVQREAFLSWTWSPSAVGAVVSVSLLVLIWVREIVLVDFGRITSLLASVA